jgi:hypothetical protein
VESKRGKFTQIQAEKLKPLARATYRKLMLRQDDSRYNPKGVSKRNPKDVSSYNPKGVSSSTVTERAIQTVVVIRDVPGPIGKTVR